MNPTSIVRSGGRPEQLVYPWLQDLPARQRDVVREFVPLMDKLSGVSDDFHAVELISRTVESYFADRAKPDKRRDFALAVLRGKVAREGLKLEEGGHVSASEAADTLGISKTALLKRFNRGQILGWREAKQDAVRLPVWQFKGDNLLPGLTDVLKILNSALWMDDWGRILFFLNRSESTSRNRPLDLLRSGKLGQVINLAKATIE